MSAIDGPSNSHMDSCHVLQFPFTLWMEDLFTVLTSLEGGFIGQMEVNLPHMECLEFRYELNIDLSI